MSGASFFENKLRKGLVFSHKRDSLHPRKTATDETAIRFPTWSLVVRPMTFIVTFRRLRDSEI